MKITAQIQASKRIVARVPCGTLFALLCLILIGQQAFAQTPLPLPNPNLDLRTVSINFSTSTSVVALPDGGAIVPYTARWVGGQPRSPGLVKLRPDGSIDTTWSVTGFSIFAMALDGDDLYLAGNFLSINGIPRRGLARVSVSNGAVSSWNPNGESSTNYTFLSIALSGGAAYVGGTFTHIGTSIRSNLAKIALDSIGTLDTAWTPSASASVYSVVIDGSAAYIGGDFAQLNSVARNGVAKVDSLNGALDNAWVPTLGVGASSVRSAVADNGNYYFTGCFTQVNGATRRYIARVSLSGSGILDPTWNPNAGSGCTSGLAVTASHVYLGGFFTQVGGQSAIGVARVSKSGAGSLDATWQPDLDEQNVPTIVPMIDNSVILMGSFVSVGSGYSPAVARISNAGALTAPAIFAEARASVSTLLPAADGGTFVGGNFTAIGNLPRRGLLKLAVDGSYDPSFATVVRGGNVQALQRDANHIYVGGNFDSVGGVGHVGLARILEQGTVDTWNVNAGPTTSVVALAFDEADNTVIVGGSFSSIGGQSRNRLAKVSRSTALATAWNPALSGSSVNALLVDSGELFVGGTFTNIGGAARNNLAKLSPSTGLADPAFTGGASSQVRSLVPGPAGTLYVGGAFSTLGGSVGIGMGRVFRNSGLSDASWSTFPGSPNVHSIASSADGVSIYVAGAFDAFDGQPRDQIARVSHTGVLTDFAPNAAGVTTVLEQGRRVVVGGTLNRDAPSGTTQIGVLAFPIPDPSQLFCDGFENAGCSP